MPPSLGVELVALRLDLESGATDARLRWLSPEERGRAARFRFEGDRRRYGAARALLRELLGRRLGVAPQSIIFAYGKNGKPVLGAPYSASGWHFNLSHCDDVVVYAFSRLAPVGVDVEALRALPEADNLAAHFFSAHEWASYRALAPHERALGFFSCWTRKEAIVKALGEGLAIALSDIDVSLAPNEPPALLRIAGAPAGPGWRLESFSPFPGFIAALATRH